MSSLDLDTINQLLQEQSQPRTTRTPSPKSGTGATPHVRPMQVGPLRYMESDGRCASRGCSGPTHIEVEGVRRCTSHALYELNRIIIAQDSYLDSCVKDCDCNAGRHSVGNVHTSDCATFIRLSEDKSDSSNAS